MHRHPPSLYTGHMFPLTHLGCGLSAGQALDVTKAATPPRRTKAMERGPCPSTATPVLTRSTATRVYQHLEGKATVLALGDPQKSQPRFSPRIPARLLTTTPCKPLSQGTQQTSALDPR